MIARDTLDLLTQLELAARCSVFRECPRFSESFCLRSLSAFWRSAPAAHALQSPHRGYPRRPGQVLSLTALTMRHQPLF